MKSKYMKQGHRLPQEVSDAVKTLDPKDLLLRNAYICLLRDNEWSLHSIGEAFSMTRERVRQISRDGEGFSIPGELLGLPAPTPPLRPVQEPRVVPTLSSESLAWLLRLKPLAQSVRSNSPNFREEAENYTAIMYKEYSENKVPLSVIARALGITTPSIRFRFHRYGYVVAPNVTSKCYKPILQKNRYVLQS